MKVQYKLLQNFGTDEAKLCNTRFGTSIPLDSASLAAGETIDLNDAAAKHLKEKYPALLEATTTVHGVAKAAEIHGTPEKATEDLKRYKEKGTVQER